MRVTCIVHLTDYIRVCYLFVGWLVGCEEIEQRKLMLHRARARAASSPNPYSPSFNESFFVFSDWDCYTNTHSSEN